MFECRECYEDTDISAGKIKQFCKTCNTQVSWGRGFVCLVCFFCLFFFPVSAHKCMSSLSLNDSLTILGCYSNI